jgi:hypothetical protein
MVLNQLLQRDALLSLLPIRTINLGFDWFEVVTEHTHKHALVRKARLSTDHKAFHYVVVVVASCDANSPERKRLICIRQRSEIAPSA